MRSEKWMGILMLCLASILWGGTVVPSKWLLAEMTPEAAAAARFAVAGLVLLPWALLRYHRQHGFGEMNWGRLMLQGLLGVTLYYIPSYWGLKMTSGVHASMLSGVAPLIVVLMSALMLRERMTTRQWVASLVAVVGVLMIVLPAEQDTGPGGLWGDLLLILSAVCWGIYTALTKRWESKLPSEVSTAWMVTFGSIFLMPFIWMGSDSPGFAVLATPQGFMSLLYLGVGASALAYFFWNKSLAYVSASLAGLSMNLLPAVALLASVFVLGESVGLLAILGGLLSVAAVYFGTM